jgi:hypothetical protein
VIKSLPVKLEGDFRPLKWAVVWGFFLIVAFFGLMYLGRYILAAYPWQDATDIGISFKNGGFQFRIVPFIPLWETVRLLIAFWLYVTVIQWLFAQAKRHASPFGGKRIPES